PKRPSLASRWSTRSCRPSSTRWRRCSRGRRSSMTAPPPTRGPPGWSTPTAILATRPPGPAAMSSKASAKRTCSLNTPSPPPGCTRAPWSRGSCLVAIDEAGRIQVWANNKQPFRLRWQLASALGLPEDRIRVNPCAIGGDFGGKAGAMDVPLAYALAQRTGRPVKMIMDYVEELLAGNPRHPAVITIKSGVKQDGRLWARHTRVVYNGGGHWGCRGGLAPGGRRRGGWRA